MVAIAVVLVPLAAELLGSVELAVDFVESFVAAVAFVVENLAAVERPADFDQLVAAVELVVDIVVAEIVDSAGAAVELAAAH